MLVRLTGWLLLVLYQPLAHPTFADTYTVLHSFARDSEGYLPEHTALTHVGSTLYGTNWIGGPQGNGTIFRVNTDGTGFGLVHAFAAGVSDGSHPVPGVTLLGSTLYGTAQGGGTANKGAVYKVDADGNGFQLLHSFAGGDGANPVGALTASGSTLYGTTWFGGTNGIGTLFKLNADGSGFSLLHSFTGGTSDGAAPFSRLTISGSTIYGTTSSSGSNANNTSSGERGTIFKINTDGTGYTVLRTFNPLIDGGGPVGGLTLSGTTLYGTTHIGGATNDGTLFKINVDGSGFTLLHTFSGGIDGANPFGDLTLYNSVLYGTTHNGANSDGGVLFQIDTDGSDFTVLHAWNAFVGDGNAPGAGVTLVGSTLYGTTTFGGQFDGGTVFSFSLNVPEPSGLVLATLGFFCSAAWGFRRRKQCSRGD